MKRMTSLVAAGLTVAATAVAADRAIDVPPQVAMSWAFATHASQSKPARTMGVGFWQRGSGAKPGVGENFVTVVEYQLPESAPARLRSATLQFSAKPAQCVGAEPVVVDVYAYAADGKAEVGDAGAGVRIAQMTADCSDHTAFSRAIDVTNVVRQHLVPAGVHHVGFNVRKANNRQGPGLFNILSARLTVVLADQEIEHHSRLETALAQLQRARPRAEPAATDMPAPPMPPSPAPAPPPAATAAVTPAPAVAGARVPAELQGTWARDATACASGPRLHVGGDRVRLESASDVQVLAGLEVAGPGYFPPDYRGISAVLFTEFEGDQPATITFNPGERRGLAQVEFAPVMPGRATPQLARYNARVSQLDLARRFPMNRQTLRRCTAAAAAR
jgi:hypothetical protein